MAGVDAELTATVYSAFGAKVRNARRIRGLDQVDLAVAVGMSQASISKIETGKGEPNIGRVPLHVAVALADFLGLSLDNLSREGQ
jgi:transcriptional regulator with XRE-family HTH domain